MEIYISNYKEKFGEDYFDGISLSAYSEDRLVKFPGDKGGRVTFDSLEDAVKFIKDLNADSEKQIFPHPRYPRRKLSYWTETNTNHDKPLSEREEDWLHELLIGNKPLLYTLKTFYDKLTKKSPEKKKDK